MSSENQTVARCELCGHSVEEACIERRDIILCPHSLKNPRTPDGRRTVRIVMYHEIGYVTLLESEGGVEDYGITKPKGDFLAGM